MLHGKKYSAARSKILLDTYQKIILFWTLKIMLQCCKQFW